MTDAIGPTADGRVVEVGHDGPLVRLHVHGGQSAALDAGQRDQFARAFFAAERQAEANQATAVAHIVTDLDAHRRCGCPTCLRDGMNKVERLARDLIGIPDGL
jgi:hypothetical protein